METKEGVVEHVETTQAKAQSRPGRQASSGPHPPHRSSVIAHHQQNLHKWPAEVTALAVADLPFRCVVAGDRSGAVRV